MPRLTLAFLLLTAWMAGAAESKKDIVWQHQFDDAMKLAKDTGKPLLIDFWATWCEPCKRMEREVWTDERLRSMSDRYIFASVDADMDKSTMSHYFVKGIPTVVVADPWGHAVQKREGYINTLEVLDLLSLLPSDYGQVKQWFDTLEGDGKNAKAMVRIGQFYADRHAFRLSSEFYANALKTSAAREDATLREDLLLATAINSYHDGNLGDARKKLDQCLKEFPDGRRLAQALSALVAVELKQAKRGDAEKTLQELKRRFPDSPATENAAVLLSQEK